MDTRPASTPSASMVGSAGPDLVVCARSIRPAPLPGARDLATGTSTMVGRTIRAWHDKQRRFEASMSRRRLATLGQRWRDPAKGRSLVSEVSCDGWGSPLP